MTDFHAFSCNLRAPGRKSKGEWTEEKKETSEKSVK
jgi:hypothetical protein